VNHTVYPLDIYTRFPFLQWKDKSENGFCYIFQQNLGGTPGGPQGAAEDGDESWDEDDDASSYRDDSSSDGDEDADDIGTSRAEGHSVPGPSQPAPSTSTAATTAAGTAAGTKHAKELEWDHSSM